MLAGFRAKAVVDRLRTRSVVVPAANRRSQTACQIEVVETFTREVPRISVLRRELARSTVAKNQEYCPCRADTVHSARTVHVDQTRESLFAPANRAALSSVGEVAKAFPDAGGVARLRAASAATDTRQVTDDRQSSESPSLECRPYFFIREWKLVRRMPMFSAAFVTFPWARFRASFK